MFDLLRLRPSPMPMPMLLRHNLNIFRVTPCPTLCHPIAFYMSLLRPFVVSLFVSCMPCGCKCCVWACTVLVVGLRLILFCVFPMLLLASVRVVCRFLFLGHIITALTTDVTNCKEDIAPIKKKVNRSAPTSTIEIEQHTYATHSWTCCLGCICRLLRWYVRCPVVLPYTVLVHPCAFSSRFLFSTPPILNTGIPFSRNISKIRCC